MARLIDRLRHGGTRQLNFYELIENSVAGRVHDPDGLGKLIALRRAEGQDLTEAQALAELDSIKVKLSAVTSGIEFGPETFRRATVIAGDEVGRYFAAQPEGTRMSGLLSVCMPPFEWTFIDFDRVPNQLGLRQFGVLLHLSELTGDRHRGQSEARWLVTASTHGAWDHAAVGPLSMTTYVMDDAGVLMQVPVDPSRIHLPADPLDGIPSTIPALTTVVGATPEISQRLTPEDHGRLMAYLNELVYAALLTVSFCHAKNVDVIEVEPNPRMSRSHRKRHGQPLTTFYTLNIDPLRKALDTDGEAGTKGLGHALHTCRGHFRTYSSERPMFGRLAGTYWVSEHSRGDAVLGEIVKDYRVDDPDPNRVGRYWIDPDDGVEVASADKRGSSPDLSGRGLRAHQHTVRLLAEHLHDSNLEPRRPRPDEPQWDCAWLNGAFWVAEVKSITDDNETAQVRAAIGQVIDYRHTLRALLVAEVRAAVVLEREPTDLRWVEVCAAEQIALVWPGAWDRLHEPFDPGRS
jgi:hypothetical protein